VFSYMKQGKEFYRNLLRLAMPIILQNLVITFVALIDIIMLGWLDDEAIIAAVDLANVPVFVIMLLVFGLMSGSSVLISQYWGKGDEESISRVIGVGWYIAGVVSLVFALVMYFTPETIMQLLTPEQRLIEIACEYARPIGISYFFTSLAGVFTGAQRSMENPKFGLYTSSVSIVLNLIFNYMFIFGNWGAPRWGVFGAAFATLLARMGEFVVVIIYIVCAKRFRLDLRRVLRPGKELLGRYVKYASPVIVNETLWGLGFSMYRVVMGHMENETPILAAYSVSGNLEKLFGVFMFGLGNAAAIIIGKEVGAGRVDTVYQKGKALGMTAMLLGAVLGVCIAVTTKTFFEPYIYPVFSLSPLACDIATMMMLMTATQMPLRAFNNTNIVGILRGGGDVKGSMWVDVIPLWFFAVPAAVLVGNVFALGIFWVMMVHWFENLIKFVWGQKRLRAGQWIRDVTVGD
jgi:putative efflux protein, MATE family